MPVSQRHKLQFHKDQRALECAEERIVMLSDGIILPVPATLSEDPKHMLTRQGLSELLVIAKRWHRIAAEEPSS